MSCDIEATIDQRPIESTIEGAIVNISGGAGGLVDGDYGDIAVSGNGTVWTIENMADTATVTTGTYVSNVNQALVIKARKASAGTITKGQVVYITGSSGTHLLVELAQANAENTSAYTIGIASTNITNTTDGYVVQNGRLTGLSTVPTASFADGNAIYLSETTAGGYRVGIPQAPNHGVFLGFVVKASNGGSGEIDVRVDNYQELEELSDVYVSGANVNDFLVKKTTRWENTTPANVKTILAINNVDNTSDLNKPISTATQTALDGKIDENTPITGATKTKITYDSKGLVTAGTDATTADISDSSNKRYVTDADLIKLNNLSGTNTGDQTSIVGITGTKAQFNTAVTDGNILYVGDITQYTDEQAQDAVGNNLQDSASIDFTYNDAGNFITASVKSNTTIQQVELIKSGSPVFSTRKQLNLIEGSNITIDISDDPINDRADITINSTASSSFTYPQLVSLISLRI